TSDGQQGLQMALRHKPDLILLDLEMPRLRGNEVLEKLAEQHVHIPVILMTFHGSEDIAIEVYRLGVKDYIKKPYYPDEMLAAIEKALTETRLLREKEALTQRILYANRQLQQRLEELNILYDVGKTLTERTDVASLLTYIVDVASDITAAESSELYLLDGEILVCRAQKQRGRSSASLTDTKQSTPMVTHTVRHKKSLILNRKQLEQRPLPGNPITAASVPLILRGQIIGALTVSRYIQNSESFTDNDGNLLQALGDYAVIALENATNYTQLAESQVQMRDTFERFVAPSVVEQALNRPDEVRPGGERQMVSVLFADIRGYTAWSENAAPEQVIETLNHYLNLAGGVIIGWEGTLDKFVGDGLMAIFN
ncbi:MAG: response regulator, partial [Aggregatilineales bacterium]